VVCLTALAGGCGDDSNTAGTDGPGESTDDGKFVVVALGDSITAGSPLWDPDRGIRVGIGSQLDQRSQYEYWAARKHPELAFRNCGVFGERTDQIAERLGDCAAGADALVIQGGINDIAQGRAIGQAADDLEAMVAAGKDLGIPVALTDVLPWNNGHPGADGPIAGLNRAIERIGRDEDVPVLPFHDTLEDPARPGTMKAAWTIDGDHPSVEGYRRLGEQAFMPPAASQEVGG